MRPDRADVVRGGLVTALVLAAALFIVRGPIRGVDGPPYDASLIYGAARAWLLGINPYEGKAVARVYLDAGGSAEAPAAAGASMLLLYPPVSFVVLAPLAALGWSAAMWVWMVANVACAAISIWAVGRVAGLAWTSVGGLVFMVLALAFGASHTAIALGQTSLFACAAISVGAWLLHGGRTSMAGLLMGLATVIKPQLGLPFLIYVVAVGRWRAFWPAMLLLGGALTVAVVRLWLAEVVWVEALRRNIAEFAAHGPGSPAGPLAYQLINFQVPATFFSGSAVVGSAVAWGLVAAVGAGYFARRHRREATDLLSDLSMVSVLALLAVYHRYYDAVVLLFVLAWAAAAISDRRWRAATAVLMVAAPLMIPWSALLVRLVDRGMVPATLGESWLWQALVLPLHAWAILGVGVVLLVHAWRAGPVSATGAGLAR